MDSKSSFDMQDCDIEQTRALHEKDVYKIEYLVPKQWELAND